MTEEEENDDFSVPDPDDYQKKKKLEIIHSTKNEILKIRNNRMDLIRDYHDFGKGSQTGNEVYKVRLAKAVAQYGSELLPLIEEALENGTLDESDLKVSLSSQKVEMDVVNYIKTDGQIRYEGDLICPPDSNHVGIYRQLDRIQRKLGLGLELEENKGPAKV